MSRVRVLIVDDHAIVREGIRSVLSADASIEVVGEAEDGIEACVKAARHRPDVVIMDVSMPGLNGPDATRRIMVESPGTKVVALTIHEEPPYVRDLLRAGASAYLLKRAAVSNLSQAIHRVMGGGIFLDPQLASSRRPTVDIDPAALSADLTAREIDVASLSARGHSLAAIAQTLSISPKTVETHKTRLMTKLGLKTRAELVRYAVYRGWLSD